MSASITENFNKTKGLAAEIASKIGGHSNHSARFGHLESTLNVPAKTNVPTTALTAVAQVDFEIEGLRNLYLKDDMSIFLVFRCAESGKLEKS